MYKRILLKLTGELFGPPRQAGIDFIRVKRIANYLNHLSKIFTVELAIVVGGGNLFRGRNITSSKFDPAQADSIGMLATVMNALALQGELEAISLESRVLSAVHADQLCEPYIRRKALTHLDRGIITILAGGTDRPFFTTDTTAALLAAELNCNILLKGSTVDGVYNMDPNLNPDATKYHELTFREAMEKGLMVMDDTAFAVCKRQKIPIIVFKVDDLDNIEKILKGQKIGTLIQ